MALSFAPTSKLLALLGLTLGLAGPLPGQAAQQGQGRRRTSSGIFEAQKALFSRQASSEIPDPASEPDADQLAEHFGLEKLAAPGPGGETRWRHPGTGMLFVFVSGGDFEMGSGYSNIFQRSQITDSARVGRATEEYFASEQPRATIYLSPFFIGVYEVTVGDWEKFMQAYQAGDLEHLNYPSTPPEFPMRPYSFKKRLPFWGERQPIVGIHWLQAYTFCKWLGGRMPTEAEWEKAARGTDGRIFPWGNRFDPMRANTRESLNRRPLPVGTYPGGRSPYGCFDMAGNVAEYTMDAFEVTSYSYRSRANPCLLELKAVAPSGFRVLRGGSWNSKGYLFKARTTGRGRVPIQLRFGGEKELPDYMHLGFRPVLSSRNELYPDGWIESRRERAREIFAKKKAEFEAEQKRLQAEKDGAAKEQEGGAED